MSSEANQAIPIFLLKAKSSPRDAYEDIFQGADHNQLFDTIFVPVLQHRFETEGTDQVYRLLKAKKINGSSESDYGGLIFTSQRAVEAFSKVIQDGMGDKEWARLQDVPVYSVGPATTRALKAIPQSPPLKMFGEHTGNGDNLAKFILEHYAEWYKNRRTKPPLLFLVGESRRDIIPKTLTDEGLPDDRRIPVTEIVVYDTGVMESFAEDFAVRLEQSKDALTRWVVVFSPTGCDSMLRVISVLDEDGKVKSTMDGERRTFVAAIGPTTRDYLKKFGFEPDVCAAKPSPEGLLSGIIDFMKSRCL